MDKLVSGRPPFGLPNPLGPVGPSSARRTESQRPVADGAATGKSSGFQAVLEQEVRRAQPLRISGHARMRLEAAGVQMSESVMARLTGAVERAEAKGARSSLVLLDDIAFVVSVKNRTVITAIERERAKDNVFTQIDSAVIT